MFFETMIVLLSELVLIVYINDECKINENVINTNYVYIMGNSIAALLVFGKYQNTLTYVPIFISYLEYINLYDQKTTK